MKTIIRNDRILTEELFVDETIFSIANGFLGIRGTFAEGYGEDDYNQTLLNGFYDYYDYKYEENFTGFPQVGQKIVNLIDGSKIRILVNNKELNIHNCEILFLKREYRLDEGITYRQIGYKTVDDYEFILTEKKLVSNDINELITIDLTIESLNFEGIIEVISTLELPKKVLKEDDPRISNIEEEHLIITDLICDKEYSVVLSKTNRSELYLSTAMAHNSEFSYKVKDRIIYATKKVHVEKNTNFNVTKYLVYTSSLYNEDYKATCTNLIKGVKEESFEFYKQKQLSNLHRFWDNSEVRIHGNDEMNDILNYSIYQLNSSGGESEEHNIAAKGLSGEGYEGHYFWDTEIYLLPFFILTNPKKAKNLIMYRYNKLEQARVERANLGYQNGVKIPWRTINGFETSPYYPAGSAQFHINSDVAYSVIKYFEATNDHEFMNKEGFTLLLETARFLLEAGNYHNDKFHINNVTGPDEYTTVVNDNYYTNVMAKYHFSYLSKYYSNNLQQLSNLCIKLGVTAVEIKEYQEAADKMELIFDEDLNIFAQDSSFLSKKKLYLDLIPKDKTPLLLHYHPLYLYKHQVLKQADTLLGMLLLDFNDKEVLKNTFNYYKAITTHDSSLSKCIYGIIAYKLKEYSIATEYFNAVLETDIKNTHHNTKHGLHVANLGGSYLTFIFGIVGLIIKENILKIAPIKPRDIDAYELSVFFNGTKIKIKVSNELVIETKELVKIQVYDEVVDILGEYRTSVIN